jgi:hypothetical protein
MHNRSPIRRVRGQKRKGENRICGNSPCEPADSSQRAPFPLRLLPAPIRLAPALLAIPFALVGPAVAGTALAASGPAGRAAQSLSANDEGHLHLIGESGAYLIEEGKVMGSLAGRVRVWFELGTSVTARFILYPKGGGSISGHGSGKLNSAGRYASFGGSMSVTSGTGRFAHASGQGSLYGTILREGSFPVVVQTRGTLHY